MICDVAGLEPTRIKAFPWWAVALASPFVAMLKEMLEMRYLWPAAAELDNRKLISTLGSEPHTPARDAVRITLEGLGCLPSTECTTAVARA